ncbi:hypothetical protein D9M71_765990 [compost metagenome]
MQRQSIQCVACLLLLGRAGDQLTEGHVTLEFVGFDQFVQTAAQELQAFQQLGLVSAAHQVELAGGLVTGDACHSLSLFEQLRRAADPLADVVAAVQLPEAGSAEQG